MLDTDVGKVFDVWSDVSYKSYKTTSIETDWCSLIRQKINNLYTKYFDEDVILNKDYMFLLNTPKRLYFQWLDGFESDANELTKIIDDAICEANQKKCLYQKQKMEMSWNDYKKLIEVFLNRAFNNCKKIEDYECKTEFKNMYSFMNEDNFYIKYICKTLECEMLKYQKKYYGIREHRKYKRCCDCGDLFEFKAYNQKRCVDCQTLYNRKNKTEKQKKYRVEKLKNQV